MKMRSLQFPTHRHPKCSALYANHLHKNFKASKCSIIVPSSAVYLSNVTVEVTTKSLTKDALTFAITVHDNKSSSTWRHLRSYSECEAFQNRVLKVLSRGHLCFAECPWLFSYVQRSLPTERTASYFFRLSSDKVKSRIVERRRQDLVKLLATLQRVLLNPLNQRCKVLMDQVAPEVITFITNRSGIDAVEAFKSPGNDQTLAKPFSDSFVFEIDEDKESDNDILGQSSSSTNTILNDVDEDVTTAEDVDDPVFTLEKMVAGQRVCCAMCALHNTRSDEQVFACWQSGSVTSRFIRLRADAGAQRVSPSVESPVLAQSRSPQGGSARDSLNILHEMLSPLHPYVVSDNQKAGLAVTMHDGTPTLPFPESPGTPPTLRDSTAFQIHLDRQDDWQQKEDASSPTCELPAAANIKLSPRLENFRPLSHRSLIVFHSIRNKFMSRKHCVI